MDMLFKEQYNFFSKSRPFTEYISSIDDDGEPSIIKSIVDTGHCLNFSFMQGYGNAETFGKDKNVFYN